MVKVPTTYEIINRYFDNNTMYNSKNKPNLVIYIEFQRNNNGFCEYFYIYTLHGIRLKKKNRQK
jgi:hypothetical protein